MSHSPRGYDAVIQTLGRIALLCVLGMAVQAEATDVRLNTATIRLVGNDSVQISGSVSNLSTVDSATLKLELWAFAAPWDGTGFGTAGAKVAEDVIGRLDAQSGVGIINDSRSYTPPPAGTWYFTMILTEFAAGETGDGGYVLRSFLNFPVPVTVAPTPANYQGLWWVPGGAESFWGINFAHQGDQVFGTWYTYDTNGNAYWLSMLAQRTTPTSNTYTGDINVDVGPPFNNFVGSGTYSKVGTGTVTFSDANNGSFNYNLNAGTGGSPVAVTQTKALARFDLGAGAQPTCTFSTTANLAAATNYQDLWWAASGAESGWGINFAHQGNSIFATWYTYDAKGASNNPPMWLSALLQRQGTSNVFNGPISRTSGPRFDNYKASDVAQPIPTIGSATVTFADGNSATFNYTTNGNGGLPAAVNQTKPIARFPFGAGGTVCH